MSLVSSIHEISGMVKQSYQIILKMKQLTLKPELTNEDITWFTQSKNELDSVLSRLKCLDPNLVEKIIKRQTKRQRQKKKREERRQRKETKLEREEAMDEWMREKRREDEMKHKTLLNQRLLSEKVTEIEKHISLLSQLEKLNSIRGGNIEPVTPKLSVQLSELRNRIERDGETVCWNEYLFGVEASSFEESLTQERLLEIRRDWDQFISSEATATSIPIGWVTPSTPCDHWQGTFVQQ
ncbi:hypothetical protein WDU94_009919 [Cyamophila willieti]